MTKTVLDYATTLFSCLVDGYCNHKGKMIFFLLILHLHAAWSMDKAGKIYHSNDLENHRVIEYSSAHKIIIKEANSLSLLNISNEPPDLSKPMYRQESEHPFDIFQHCNRYDYNNFKEKIDRVIFNRDKTKCATYHTCNDNTTVIVYDTLTGKEISVRKCFPLINDIAFHPLDDNFIITHAFTTTGKGYGDSTNPYHFHSYLSIYSLHKPDVYHTALLKDYATRCSNDKCYCMRGWKTDLKTLLSHPHKSELCIHVDHKNLCIIEFTSAAYKSIIVHVLQHLPLPRDLIQIIAGLIKSISIFDCKLINYTNRMEECEYTYHKNKKIDQKKIVRFMEQYDFTNHTKTSKPPYTHTVFQNYSNNGKYLISVRAGKMDWYRDQRLHTIRLYETENYRQVEKFYSEAVAIGIHPNNAIFALISRNTLEQDVLSYWDIKTVGPLDFKYTWKKSSYSDWKPLCSLIFSDDGKKLYAQLQNKIFELTVPDMIVNYAPSSIAQEHTNTIPPKIDDQIATESIKEQQQKKTFPIITFFKNNCLFFITALGAGSFCIGWLLFARIMNNPSCNL